MFFQRSSCVNRSPYSVSSVLALSISNAVTSDPPRSTRAVSLRAQFTAGIQL